MGKKANVVVKKKDKKPDKIEKELKQVRKCLKDKDERIENLEGANKNAEEEKEYMIRSFNFLSMLFFTVAMFVFISVCHQFYPSWFMDIAPHFAILGCFAIVGNVFIGLSAFIYDSENDDIAWIYLGFNCIAMPIILLFYWFIQAAIINLGSS